MNEKIWSVSMADFDPLGNEDNGICLACGAVRYGNTEPDAEKYPCDDCEQNEVYGMQQALIMGRITIDEYEGEGE